jgi:hypothetical protein
MELSIYAGYIDDFINDVNDRQQDVKYDLILG